MLTDTGLPLTDENVFIAAACQEKGILFLEGKATLGIRKKAPPSAAPAAAAPRTDDVCTVTVGGKAYTVAFQGDQAVVNGQTYPFSVTAGAPEPTASAAAPASASVPITAPVPGIILRITAHPGQTVKAGDEILIMEAMKMEMPVKAPSAGIVSSIEVTQAQKINTGDILAHIS